jgi:hypothetical protein
MKIKPTDPVHNGLKNTLVVGASALGAASSHAAVVYLDTAGKDLTVAGIENTTYEDTLDFYYDSATHEIGIGGTYGNGENRGIQILSKGKNGQNRLAVGSKGWIDEPRFYYTSTIVNGGATPLTVGSIIGIDSNFASSGEGVSFRVSGVDDLYIGIRVWAGVNDGFYNYGWAKVKPSEDQLSMTLKELAFETEINTPITITASAVPEPGSMVSLAALLSSAALIRTRRKAMAA